MRILCTNDDGIHATGLAVLEKIARTFSDDVWVIAPEQEQSGASRALTLTETLIGGSRPSRALRTVSAQTTTRRPLMKPVAMHRGSRIASFEHPSASSMPGRTLVPIAGVLLRP